MEMKDIIAKVNYYSALAKKKQLTDEEIIERQKYRTLYLEHFKSQVKGHLDQIKVIDEDGNKVKLKKN